MIRKRKFGIAIKLSLMVSLIVVISFAFILSFFQKSQQKQLEEQLRVETGLKIENLRQDVINYAFGLETGDERLADLQKKISATYENSLSENQLAVLQELAYISKEGRIVAHNRGNLQGLSFYALEKRRLTPRAYKDFLSQWFNMINEVSDSKQEGSVSRDHESLYQILVPIYYTEKYIRGLKRIQMFFDFWKAYQQGTLLKNISLDPFLLGSFEFFSHFWQARELVLMKGDLSDKGKDFIKEVARSSRELIRDKVLTARDLPNRADVERIRRVIMGIFSFTEEFWYDRLLIANEVHAALENLNKISQRNLLAGAMIQIRKILEENRKLPYLSWKGKLIMSVRQYEKIYRESIAPFEQIIELSKAQERLGAKTTIFNWSEKGIFTIPGRLEELSDQDDAVNAYIKDKIENLSWWEEHGQEHMELVKGIVKEYLEVSVKQQERFLSPTFLKQGLAGLYRIKLFEAAKSYQGDNFQEVKKNLEEERDNWLARLDSGQLFYKGISIYSESKENYGLGSRKELLSFYFFIYVHHYLSGFIDFDGSLRQGMDLVVNSPVREQLKNFKKLDIDQLAERVSYLGNMIRKLYQAEQKSVPLAKTNLAQIEGQQFSLKGEWLTDFFKSLVNRYHVGYLLVRISKERMEKAIRQETNYLLDLGVSLLLRFIFVAVLFAAFFLKKFRLLFQGVEIVGEGALSYQIQIKGSDEFGQLADHFNHMTGNLSRAQVELVEKSRMEEELQIAERIQSTLLPKVFPEYAGLKFASYYSAQTETGGDYFDFIELDQERVGLIIADVSGHGVGACLVMSMIRTLVRSYAHAAATPKELLLKVNDYVYSDTPSNMYATIFYAILNVKTGVMEYTIGGHNAGVIYHPQDQSIEELATGGMAVGIVATPIFQNTIKNFSFQLREGDLFIQYTDGVTEAMDEAQNEYGMERLLKTVKSARVKTIQTMLEKINTDIEAFTQGYLQTDDITMMGLQYK